MESTIPTDAPPEGTERRARRALYAPGRFVARHPRAFLLIAALLFTVVWTLPSLVVPLSTDEVIYTLGGRTVLRGHELYRDFWDIKPPAIYLAYAIPMKLWGEHLESLRVFDMVSLGLGVAGVFLLTARFFGDRAGLIGGCLFAFTYFGVAWFGNMGEAESYMAGPITLAFAVYGLRGRRSLATALLAGTLLGLATAFKLSGGLLAFGFPVMELLFHKEEGWSIQGALGRLTLAAVGFLAVQGGWVAYLMDRGTWDLFVDIQNNYTIPYNRYHWPEEMSHGRWIFQSTFAWLSGVPYIAAPAWAALFLAAIGIKRKEVTLLAFLMVMAWASVTWQGKFFDYHWVIMLPIMAPMAAFAIDTAIHQAVKLPPLGGYAAGLVLGLSVIVIGVWPVIRVVDTYGTLIDRANGRLTEQDVDDKYIQEFSLNREIVDYVRLNSGPEDSLFVFGFWVQPYFWLERPLATRFVTSAALRSKWSPVEWRQEFIRDLQENRPRFVAIAAGDHQPWLTGTGEASDQHMCDSWPAFRLLMEQNYHAVLNNGLFVLYDIEAPEHLALPRCVWPPP